MTWKGFFEAVAVSSIAFVVGATFWGRYLGFTLEQRNQLMFLRILAAIYFVAWVTVTIIRAVSKTVRKVGDQEEVE